MNDATTTLSGNYGTVNVPMPDGTEVPVMVRKVPRGDGTFGWAVINEAVADFEASEVDTDFQADDHVDPQTEAVTKRPTTISTVSEERQAISLDLLQFLGDPDPVIANKRFPPEKLAAFKAHPLSVTMARRLCIVYGGKWREVLKYLPKYYPESHGG